jgi:hypothetical protein
MNCVLDSAAKQWFCGLYHVDSGLRTQLYVVWIWVPACRFQFGPCKCSLDVLMPYIYKMHPCKPRDLTSLLWLSPTKRWQLLWLSPTKRWHNRPCIRHRHDCRLLSASTVVCVRDQWLLRLSFKWRAITRLCLIRDLFRKKNLGGFCFRVGIIKHFHFLIW